MDNEVELLVGGNWIAVREAPDDCRDREPSAKSRPNYRVYAIRHFRSDPKVAVRVLDWLARE